MVTKTGVANPLDVMALLERVERQEAHGTRGVLSVEIDDLLGRRGRSRSQQGGGKTARKTRARPHAWYFDLLERAPEVPTPYRTARAARAVEAGVLAEEQIATTGALSLEDLANLEVLVACGKNEYRFLIESNLRLVFYWARRQEHLVGEDAVQDAFQAGCLGLMRGIQGWDHELGFTLSTYVSSHIRQAIQRWRHDTSTTIRVPVHVWEKLESEEDGVSPRVRRAADAAQNVEALHSIDAYSAQFAWDGGHDETLETLDREILVEAMLDSISEREAHVLRLRHGLDGGFDGKTLEEIGTVLGVTRERIRQIEAKATSKLRELFAEHQVRTAE